MRIFGLSSTTLWRKIRRWPWANILTFIALCVSIFQTWDANNKYLKNEQQNDIELARIRKRDSIQLNELIDANKQQRGVDSVNRRRDTTLLNKYTYQLSLLNGSLKAQNDGIEIQNKNLVALNKSVNIQNQSLGIQLLANKSFLSLNIDLSKSKIVEKEVIVSPRYYVTNSGKTTATKIVVHDCFAVLDLWDTKKCKCSDEPPNTLYDILIKADSTVKLPGSFDYKEQIQTDEERNTIKQRAKYIVDSLNFAEYSRLDKSSPGSEKRINAHLKKYQAKEDSLSKKYFEFNYRYYLITNISYQDKYQKQVNEIYEVKFLLYDNKKFTPFPAQTGDLRYIKMCIGKNKFKFDYKKILNTVKGQTANGVGTKEVPEN